MPPSKRLPGIFQMCFLKIFSQEPMIPKPGPAFLRKIKINAIFHYIILKTYHLLPIFSK